MDTAVTSPLLLSREGGIARLRFNRPAVLNAIDVATAEHFLAACKTLAADPDLRVVIISGEGRGFIAGGDLAAMRAEPVAAADAVIGGIHQGLELLHGLRAPVIASLHGAVAGGGLGIALACDLRIAADNARFNLAYPLIGTSADCGTSWALPRLVGLGKALEIALLSEPFDAAEALRLGLVNRVVPLAELSAETERLAQRLAAGAPLALGNLKRLLRDSFHHDFKEQLSAEEAAFKACAATADFGEGLDAFFAKRTPLYQGR